MTEQNEQSADDRVGVSPLIDELRQIGLDARTYAEAELAYQKSRAAVAASGARTVALLGLAAFVLAFFALGALTVGLLLALVPVVGAFGATALVAGGLVLAAVACVLLAGARWKRSIALLTARKDAA